MKNTQKAIEIERDADRQRGREREKESERNRATKSTDGHQMQWAGAEFLGTVRPQIKINKNDDSQS